MRYSKNDNMSTEQWAEVIAESITNGQHKQARDQFRNAVYADCGESTLLFEIAGMTDYETALRFAASIIAND